uniref:Curved DNA-binding protein n=1 Tax=Noccaea caerulescens TaxID=107243 RepID=A0A1J3CSN1_NOCCA
MAASGSDPDTGNEAIHERTLAESRFSSGDLMSALNHARKALSLSPNTEGVSSMVTAFEIISSTAGGTPEWYKILKVEPFSHLNTIKQQYRKLALVLHPDKNPYAGCEEGFKLVNEAFKIFSDKVRRTEYDMKLRIRIQGEMGSEACGGGDDETSTFSTVCSDCGSVHKFDRKYLGHSLMCPSCKKSFEAKEVDKEEVGRDGSENGDCTSKVIITYSRRKKRVGEDGESLRRASEMGEMREEGAQGLNASERLDEEDETLAEMQSVIKRNKPKVKKPKIAEKNCNREEKMGREMQEISSGSDVSMTETLMEVSANKVNGKREASKNSKNTKKKTRNYKEVTEIVDLEYLPRVDRKRDRSSKLRQEMYKEDEDLDELYDFDKDRTPRSFKKGQVWAIYDGRDDKMPRSYCLVSEVVSLNPFKVWINRLDFESEKLSSWMKSHIPCGRFRVSEKALIEQVKPFSHVVNCERAAREVYQIYPRKGSVWAVYSETNAGLQRRKTRLYEIVVCLTMFSDAYGLSVAYLEKVNECSDLFKRRDYGYNAVRWIEKDDVAALLSHQVPAKKLLEDESGADLKESWVLDLASVPTDLVSSAT